MQHPAVRTDPKTGIKLFNTRAAGVAPRAAASAGYSLNAEEALKALPQARADAKYSASDQEKYKKFKEERAGAADYMTLDEKGAFGDYLKDHYSAAPVAREALRDECEVVVVGAGFGGLLLWHKLRAAGFRDVRICEKGGDVGGTWYWNRYPGAMCDIESYVYMPMLEELDYVPTERYAHAPELLQHSCNIADRYGLREKACLGTKVTGMVWEEESARWTVRTDRGDVIKARHVIMNFGTFTQPKLPRVPGLAEFKGHMFHTSRWDYGYTGGTPGGGLSGLADKRVAIIGTGATAVQVVPHLGAGSKKLYVVQRTPSSVGVRDNRPTSAEFVSNNLSKQGWQLKRQRNFVQFTQTPALGVEDLIADGWTDIVRNLFLKVQQQKWDSPEFKGKNAAAAMARRTAELMELADLEQMEKIRARADAVVSDPSTAEKLKPYYRQFCKRPCFHDDYLPTFNRPNVELVDTDGKGVERFTPSGFVVGGREYHVDCIVMATGFETGYNGGKNGLDAAESRAELGPQKVGYELVGRGGVKLSKKWRDGPRTLNSFNTHGFPNLWMQNAPQGTYTTNFVQTLDEVATHAAFIISKMKREGKTTVEPTAAAEEQYCAEVYARSGYGNRFLAECTPGYYNNEGKVTTGKTLDSIAWRAPLKFFKHLRKLRNEGRCFEGMQVV